MIKRVFFTALALAYSLGAIAQVSIEQCVALARENYPLIQKYDLLHQTQQIELADVGKDSWLPQISIYGQGTAQNVVPALPDALSDVLNQMGTDISGLGKLQYKAGIDLNQTIWDGGISKSRREIINARHTEQTASLDVQLYEIRERVENLFFAILLAEEQIKQTELTQTLLNSNLEMMRAMKANGTAMQSDVDMIEAQALTTGQQLIQAKSNSLTYRRLLSIYTGEDLTEQNLIKPEPAMPYDLTSGRPELNLFNAQIKSNEAQLGSVRTSVMPKIGFFAQAYYGYPGFNYFKSMLNRDLSFNVLAGVKISWNIDSYYTKKDKEQKLRLSSDGISVDRDVFLFNTELQTQSQTARITELQEIMNEDSRIVALRANVRRAAESQLENGVIDATALLSKITDENQARLTAGYHEIQLIQSIYQLKYTLNQ